MVEKLKQAINQIDKKMIKEWAEDLVLEKTFVGLRFQEVILRRVASLKKEDHRLATPKEESRGIDGFIGEIAISIKPITYKTKDSLKENINSKIIYYNKTKSGLEIDESQLL